MEKKRKKDNKARQLSDKFYSTKDSIIILGTPEGDRKNQEYLDRRAKIEEWAKKNPDTD